MSEKQYDFSIVFEELDKVSRENKIQLTSDESKDYEEIQTLREIVLEIQTPAQTYFTTT